MSKSKKERRVDYSLEEISKLAGLERKQFTDRLKRVIDMYGFDPTDFRLDPDIPSKDSQYFFPIEIAELLALLIRNIDKHPLYRSNVDISKVTATQVAEYNKAISDDIDNKLSKCFSDTIYTKPCHLLSRQIADWTDKLVEQLTIFLANLATMKMQDMGSTLQLFTKMLDTMNYNLFFGNEFLEYVYNDNFQARKTLVGHSERESVEKDMNRLNISIDQLIADLIKWLLYDTSKIREKIKSDEYENEINKILDLHLLLGLATYLEDKDGNKIRIRDCKEATDEQQRELYRSLLLQDDESKNYSNQPRSVMKHYREETAKWKPSYEREEYDNTDVEEIEKVQIKLIEARKEVYALERQLVELKSKKTSPEYKQHVKVIKEQYPELREVVDRFVGQTLSEFLRDHH